MLFLLQIARATTVPSWDCDTTASYSTLEEMREVYDDVRADPSFGMLSTAERWIASRVDSSCVPTDCSGDSEWAESNGYDWYECERYACVTASGSIVTWEEEHSYLGDREDEHSLFIAVDPDGTSVRYEYTYMTHGPPVGAGSTDLEWTVTWTGSPFTDAPADSSFQVSSGADEDELGTTSDGDAWKAGTCVIGGSDTNVGMSTARSYSVTIGSQSGDVDYDPDGCSRDIVGYLDGALVGAVDDRTWAVDAADGDLDGVTVGEDCDDTDPSVSPCADDIPGDGIDQDCSGSDASALLGPPLIPVGCAGAAPLPLLLLGMRRRRA